MGIGWVCENHPNLPWHDELGCQCGAGMPCSCNRRDPPDTTNVIAKENIRLVLVEEDNLTKH
jgi:hypothetical protein